MANKYKYKLKETSQTGTGSSVSPGAGEQYTGKTAYNPNKNAKGAENIYYYKLGFKPVPSKIKGSGLEVKKLWTKGPQTMKEEENKLTSSKTFQEERIKAFDIVEEKINQIYPKLSNAKNLTVEYYNDNPSSYTIVYPTDLILDYLNDIETLLNQ
jgi:hypothetical protein